MFATQSNFLSQNQNNAFLANHELSSSATYSMDEITCMNFNKQTAKVEKSVQSRHQEDKKNELSSIQAENERLQDQRQALVHKIEDLKQILRLVNAQGDDRIVAIKARNQILEDKAESLAHSLAVSRKHGAHLDQIAGFWADQEVSQDNKRSFKKSIIISEPEERVEEQEQQNSSSWPCSSPKESEKNLLLHVGNGSKSYGGSDMKQTTSMTMPLLQSMQSKSTEASDQDRSDSDRCCEQQAPTTVKVSYIDFSFTEPKSEKPKPPPADAAAAAGVQAAL